MKREFITFWCFQLTIKNGALLLTKQRIGRNSLQKFSKEVALALGKTNWTTFTAHAYKRTSVTFLADAGLTLSEIKGHTKHKSDMVVQKYIDNSAIQKRKASDALCITESKSSNYHNNSNKLRTNPQANNIYQNCVIHFGGSMISNSNDNTAPTNI